MKYIYYNREPIYLKGWIVTNTKEKYSDYCGNGWNGLITAFRCYLWYLGVPAKIAFNLWRKNKFK
jgi:hypothetical protein